MIYASIILFCIAAILGTSLIYNVVADKHLPKALKTIHSIIASAGFILLVIYAIQEHFNSYYLLFSVGCFVIAAILGVVVLRKYTPERPNVKPLALLYALMAVGGLSMLFVYYSLYLV